MRSLQPYLGPPPGGIGWSELPRALRARSGAGVRVAVLEYAWPETLADPPPYWHGAPEGEVREVVPRFEVNHGEAVLGVLTMRGGEQGPQGLCPAAGLARASIVRRVVEEGGRRTAEVDVVAAIVAATARLRPGDVLLVEAQDRAGGTLVPAETRAEVFTAIAAAVARGLVVVCPAGNGASDLDHLDAPGLERVREQDSGSILVGGGAYTPGEGWRRIVRGNHGRRITTFGPGESVHTTSAAYASGYTDAFGGTSAAAAVIAGVAALISGAFSARFGAPPPPGWVRARLTDPLLGTRCLDGEGIGSLPDLPAIFAWMDQAR